MSAVSFVMRFVVARRGMHITSESDFKKCYNQHGRISMGGTNGYC
jgi:hypothetical protein